MSAVAEEAALRERIVKLEAELRIKQTNLDDANDSERKFVASIEAHRKIIAGLQGQIEDVGTPATRKELDVQRASLALTVVTNENERLAPALQLMVDRVTSLVQQRKVRELELDSVVRRMIALQRLGNRPAGSRQVLHENVGNARRRVQEVRSNIATLRAAIGAPRLSHGTYEFTEALNTANGELDKANKELQLCKEQHETRLREALQQADADHKAQVDTLISGHEHNKLLEAKMAKDEVERSIMSARSLFGRALDAEGAATSTLGKAMSWNQQSMQILMTEKLKLVKVTGTVERLVDENESVSAEYAALLAMSDVLNQQVEHTQQLTVQLIGQLETLTKQETDEDTGSASSRIDIAKSIEQETVRQILDKENKAAELRAQLAQVEAMFRTLGKGSISSPLQPPQIAPQGSPSPHHIPRRISTGLKQSMLQDV